MTIIVPEIRPAASGQETSPASIPLAVALRAYGTPDALEVAVILERQGVRPQKFINPDSETLEPMLIQALEVKDHVERMLALKTVYHEAGRIGRESEDILKSKNFFTGAKVLGGAALVMMAVFSPPGIALLGAWTLLTPFVGFAAVMGVLSETWESHLQYADSGVALKANLLADRLLGEAVEGAKEEVVNASPLAEKVLARVPTLAALFRNRAVKKAEQELAPSSATVSQRFAL